MNHSINKPLVAGALLFLATAAIHVFIGGPEINTPIQNAPLDPVVRSVSAVIWHALTALFVVLGGALAWSARTPNRPLLATILAINLSIVGLFLGFGMMALGSIWPMPQWTLFLAISVCILLGMRSELRRMPHPKALA